MMRKKLVWLLAALLLLALTPVLAQADAATYVAIKGIYLDEDTPYLYNSGTQAQTTPPSGTTGYAYFSDGTLTLYNFSAAAPSGSYSCLRSPGDLCIKFSGSNRISNSGNNGGDSVAISVDGTLTVEGTSGSLTFSAGTGVYSSYGVEASSMIVKGAGTVYAYSGSAPDESYAIKVSSFTQQGTGTVSATGGTASGNSGWSTGIRATSTFLASSGTVTATGGTAYYSQGISGNGSVTVSGTATVTAKSGGASSGSGVRRADGIFIPSSSSTTRGVFVTGGKLTATGNYAVESNGIYASRLEVSGGTVTTTGGSATGTWDYADSGSWGAKLGTLVVSGGTLKGTSGTSDSNGISYGLYASGTTITGGAVEALSNTANTYGRGMWVSSLTMSGGTVKATGGKATNYSSTGLYVGGRGTIYGSAQVTAAGGSAKNESIGLECGGTLSVSGSAVVTATGAASTGTDSYAESYGVLCDSITVKDTAVLEGTAAKGSYSFGISADSTLTVAGQAEVNGTSTAGTTSVGVDFSNAELSGGLVEGTGVTMGVSGFNMNCSGTAQVTGTAAAGGDNTSTYYYGVKSNNKLTLSGSASVTGTVGSAVACKGSSGVFAGIVTLNSSGASLTATGGSITGTSGASYGLMVNSNLYASSSAGAQLNVSAGTINAAAGAAKGYSVGIYLSTNSAEAAASGVNITGGTVQATGGSGSASYGLYMNAEMAFAVSGGTLQAKCGSGTSATRAMNYAPDLSGYRYAGVTASTVSSGTTVVNYIPASINTYRYLRIEPGEAIVVTAAAEPALGGTVTGGGEFNPGDSVEATVTANEFYRFLGWYEGETLVSSELNYSFIAARSIDLTARFEKTPYLITDVGAGLVDVTVGEHLDSDGYAKILSDCGENSINFLLISEGVTVDLGATAAEVGAVANYGEILSGDFRETKVYNYSLITGGKFGRLLNGTDGELNSRETEEDTYSRPWLYGEVENYGSVYAYIIGEGMSVSLNDGFFAADLYYNESWAWDEGYGWEFDTVTVNYGDRVGDALGEGWYTESGEYAADLTLGLDNRLVHQWTRSGTEIIVKAAPSGATVHIPASLVGNAKSIRVTMGKLTTDRLTIPVTLSHTVCEAGSHYYESALSGGVYQDVIFEQIATVENSTINGTVTMAAAGDLRSSNTYGSAAKIVVTGSLHNVKNLFGSHDYPFTYTLPAEIASGGRAVNCTFTDTLLNQGTIESGVYQGRVTNQGLISGGSFPGGVYGAGEMVVQLSATAQSLKPGETVTAQASLNIANAAWQWMHRQSGDSAPEAIIGATEASFTLPLEQEAPLAGEVFPRLLVDEVTIDGPAVALCYEGACGGSVNWALTGHTLTLSGSGATADYLSYGTAGRAPWAPLADAIEEIVVQEGVSAIGECAFAWVPAGRVSLPQTLTSIGAEAFYSCGMTTLTIPDGVTSIGRDAFYGCRSLTEVTLPAALKSIGNSAFGSCDQLEAVALPEGLTTLGSFAFCNDTALTRVTLPSTLTAIPASAFSNTGLTRVEIPLTVETIDNTAFANCPEGLTIVCHADSCAAQYAQQRGLQAEIEPHAEEILPAAEADCVTDGLTQGSRCTICAMTLVEQTVIPATGHTVVTLEAIAPTCTEPGLTQGSACGVCGEIFQAQEALPALGHTEEIIEGLTPTCTEAGVTDYIFCVVCGAELQLQEEIPALGHTEETSLEVLAPTCTQNGHTEEISCSVCGEVLVPVQVLLALGHTETVSAEAVAPDCVNTGLTQEIGCAVCGEVLVPAEEIPALGHTAAEIPAVAPTCTEPGLTAGSCCAVCGEILLAQEAVPALGHTEAIDEAVAPTDRETGLTQGSHCALCGVVLIPQEIVPANFTFDGDTVIAYNASAPDVVIPQGALALSDTLFKGNTAIRTVRIPDSVTGLGTQTFFGCTGLTDVWLPEHFTGIGAQCFYQVDAYFHVGARSATAVALSFRGIPFTTEDGLVLRYRVTSSTGTPSAVWLVEYIGGEADVTLPEEVNGTALTQIQTGAFAAQAQLESVWIPDSVTAIADDAFDGCGEALVIRSSAQAYARTWAGKAGVAWEHDVHTVVADEAVDPTCTEPGLTEGCHCEECGEILTAQEMVPALGHKEAVLLPEAPTCTEPGLTQGAECSVCGEILLVQETVPATGHAPETVPGYAPTCTEPGLEDGEICSVCGEILLAQEVVPAPGHWEIELLGEAPTCTESGLTQGLICGDCGEILLAQEEIPATGHTAEADEGVPATHVTPGLTQGSHCALCGEVLEEQTVIPVAEVPMLVLPAGLKNIEAEAFAGTGLQCVVIPQGCESIAADAFAGNDALRFAEIPASVKNIDDRAFSGCGEGLIIVTAPGSTAQAYALERGIRCVLLESPALE